MNLSCPGNCEVILHPDEHLDAISKMSVCDPTQFMCTPIKAMKEAWASLHDAPFILGTNVQLATILGLK
jgi:hypothetical protein